jgi:hypothetical protein
MIIAVINPIRHVNPQISRQINATNPKNTATTGLRARALRRGAGLRRAGLGAAGFFAAMRLSATSGGFLRPESLMLCSARHLLFQRI